MNINELVDGFFPEFSANEQILLVFIIFVLVYLFNEIKKQLDETKSNREKRIDLTLLTLGKLDVKIRESKNETDIRIQLQESLPYLDYDCFQFLNNELNNPEPNRDKMLEYINERISRLKLRYNYLNHHVGISIIDKFEGYCRLLRGLLETLLMVLTIVIIFLTYTGIFLSSDGNQFVAVTRSVSLTLIFFFALFLVEQLVGNKFKLSIIKRLLLILLVILLAICLFLTKVWIVVLCVAGIALIILYLLKSKDE
jgi:hypothetical protein